MTRCLRCNVATIGIVLAVAQVRSYGQSNDDRDAALRATLTIYGLISPAKGTSDALTGWPIRYGIGNGDLGEVVTDARGRFSISGIPVNSRIFFSVFYKGQVEAPDQTWEVGETSASEMVIKLCRAAAVSGKVIRPNGEPMARAVVVSEGAGHRGGVTSADDKGEFILSALHAGTHHVSVEPPDGQPDRKQRIFTLDLAEGEMLTDVVLTFNPEMDNAIKWRLTDQDGNALPGARAIVQSGDRTFIQTVQADTNGELTVHDLDQGTYYISWIGHRGNEYFDGDVMRQSKAAAGSSATVAVKVEPPRDIVQFITGKIVSARTGQPIEEFVYCANELRGVIVPRAENNPFCWLNGREAEVGNSSEGLFQIRVYTAGRYALLVRAPGYAQWLGFVEQPGEDLMIRLNPQAFAKGWVVDSEGNGISGAVVVYDTVTRPGVPDRGQVQTLGSTDREGYFEVGGLEAGVVPLTLVHAEYEITPIAAAASRGGTDPADYVMRRAGKIVGRVLVDGAPYERANVQINFPDEIAPYGFGGWTDGDGRIEVGQLPMGTARIRAVLQSPNPSLARSQEIYVEVTEGARIEREFRFKSAR